MAVWTRKRCLTCGFIRVMRTRAAYCGSCCEDADRTRTGHPKRKGQGGSYGRAA